MKYKFLLFDLDGTLFDYNKAELNALEKAFNQFGFNFTLTYLDIYREINRNIWMDYEKGKITQVKLKIKRFEILAESLNLKFNPADFSETYLQNLSEGTDLINHTKEIIEALTVNHKLYLISK